MAHSSPAQHNPDTFGALLHYLRRRRRMTQIELAIATGYSVGQISRLEQNRRVPNVAAVRALFVPALELENEPELAARLQQLAQIAHERRSPEFELDSAAAVLPSGALPHVAEPMTSAPLLITKLYVPRPRPQLVARPRLRSRLDTVLDTPLTLVSAPAGFGKTTMLADWLHQYTQPHAPAQIDVAWVALDADDNDQATFLRYLIAALQTIAPAVGAATLAQLQAPQPPALAALLHTLLNELALLAHPTLLVLDDYHVIATPAIHGVMAELLDHLPPQLHLVLATRADPPLPLARLRARAQVLELRAADLRFTAEEARQFLREVMGLTLSPDDIAALDTRTEGWIAGLQLAALAMRDHNDLQHFIRAFTGSNRFVVDYLASEVFERQPAHLQAFLLQTSILQRLCGALCDAVMGIADPAAPLHGAYTQTLLEELERANLFVVPLDDERRWYRYHHLFGQVLRQRLLDGAPPDAVAQLHRRAALWYEQHGSIGEAITHALAARDQAVAAGLVEARIAAMFKRDDFITLRAWLDALPEQLVLARPRLCLARARLAILAHELDACARWLAQAEQAELPPDQQHSIRGETLILRLHLALYRDELARVIEQATQALASVPDDPQLRAEILLRLGSAQLWNGQMAVALPTFAESRRLSEAAGDTHTAIVAAYNYAATLVASAQLRAANQYLRRTIAQLQLPPAGAVPIVALLHDEWAGIFYEWNDLEQAARHTAEMIALCERGNLPRTLHDAYRHNARIAYARGDFGAAQSAIDQAATLARRYKLPERYTGQINAAQVHVWLHTGQLRAAQAWVAANDFAADAAAGYMRSYELFAFARVLIATQATTQALALLERLYDAAEADGRIASMIELGVLQALALDAQHEQAAALATLERVLLLAEPERFERTFVDEGPPMAQLLAALSRQDSAARLYPYIARLRQAFPHVANPTARA